MMKQMESWIEFNAIVKNIKTNGLCKERMQSYSQNVLNLWTIFGFYILKSSSKTVCYGYNCIAI